MCISENTIRSTWQLSRQALARIHPVVALTPSRVPFWQPTETTALCDMTAWELIVKLTSDGRAWRRGPKNLDDRDKLPSITPGSIQNPTPDPSCKSGVMEKYWYKVGTAVNVPYLQVLVDHAVLFRDKGVVEIRHLMSSRYYKQLQQGKTDGSVAVHDKRRKQRATATHTRPQLEADCGVARHPVHKLDGRAAYVPRPQKHDQAQCCSCK